VDNIYWNVVSIHPKQIQKIAIKDNSLKLGEIIRTNPQTRFANPTMMPDEKREYPARIDSG
jgi:hypothetical protein